MGRLVLFIIIAIIGIIITVIKNAAGTISGDNNLKNTTLQDETKKIMDKTAKGIGWMEKQWEESKRDANHNTIEENIKKNSFEFSPSMPDIRSGEKITTLQNLGKSIHFYKNAKTIAETEFNTPVPMSYPYVAVVMDNHTQAIEKIYAIENGILGMSFFCKFGKNGEHVNFGEAENFNCLHDFETAVRQNMENNYDDVKENSTTQSSFEFSPSMPDIRSGEKITTLQSSGKSIQFYKNVKTIAETESNTPTPMSYPYVAVITNNSTQEVEQIYAVEKGITDMSFFCKFGKNGEHVNFGEANNFTSLHCFEIAVRQRIENSYKNV